MRLGLPISQAPSTAQTTPRPSGCPPPHATGKSCPALPTPPEIPTETSRPSPATTPSSRHGGHEVCLAIAEETQPLEIAKHEKQDACHGINFLRFFISERRLFKRIGLGPFEA